MSSTLSRTSEDAPAFTPLPCNTRDAAHNDLQRRVNEAMASVWAVLQPGYRYVCDCCDSQVTVKTGLTPHRRVIKLASKHHAARKDAVFPSYKLQGATFQLALGALIDQGKVIDEWTDGVRLA